MAVLGPGLGPAGAYEGAQSLPSRKAAVGRLTAPVTLQDSEELSMQAITTIGFDIAKSVFQVHGVDAAGEVVIRRQLKRRYVLAFFQKLSPCLVGIEACA